jgi:Pectate lyase superfamily protein
MNKIPLLAIGTIASLVAFFAININIKQSIPLNDRTLTLAIKSASSENILFPQDAGVINVKDAPYLAKGNGVTDDTTAIQQALSDYPNGNKIIYLPKGTYLVSGQLRWPTSIEATREKRTILQGQNSTETIIKLKDNTTDFTNPARPKAVIWTGTSPAQRFRNAIRNLTVNTGNGNLGAIGIQFNASNQGGIRNVNIQSGDGQGVIGLDMRYTDEIGPCLIKNLLVVGFNRGISTGFKVNSQTFENITLQNQRQFGFYNDGQVINIRNLTSLNSVPAVYNKKGLMTLLNANLTAVGRSSNQRAIINDSSLFARNITTPGYGTTIQNNAGSRQNVPSGLVKEFVSHPIISLFPTPLKSLNLPIQETPEVAWDPLSQWVSPTHFGARPNDNQDDTAAIQAAIDSGKTTLYFPNGKYNISRSIFIRGNIRRIIGLEANISGKGVFQFIDGLSPVVVIERLDGLGSGIVHDSSRTLVLSSTGLGNTSSKGTSYTSKGKGNLYIEDVVGGPWTFNNQKVWARQFNVENTGTKIVNNQGTLWVLGLKTEREGIVVDTKGGGKTEIAGGLIYSNSVPKTTAMFTNDNSSVSLTLSECNFNGNPFNILISEKQSRNTRFLERGSSPRSGCNGSLIPLFVGYK